MLKNSKSILIVGDKGNMGQRYGAIIKYLGLDFIGIDEDNYRKLEDLDPEAIHSAIIATPTNTHVGVIGDVYDQGIRRILCEKPLTKDLAELDGLYKFGVEMVNQYAWLEYTYEVPLPTNLSYYNYFKHGEDGIAWDCINILGLASGECILKDNSPVWNCIINGKIMKQSHIDQSYINMLTSWLQKPGGSFNNSWNYIEKAHKKAAEWRI